MKKFLALVCSLAMIFGVTTTAFAADSVDTSKSSIVALNEVSNQISTRATSKGLWYVENYNMPSNVYNAPVTPEKGSNLNVWIKNNEEVSMQVYETNLLGTYSKIYSTTFGPGERDVKVKTNCNGKKYLVQFNKRYNKSTTISLLVYQN